MGPTLWQSNVADSCTRGSVLTCRCLIPIGKMFPVMATSRCSHTRTQSSQQQSSSWRSCAQRSRRAHTSTAHPTAHGSGSGTGWGAHTSAATPAHALGCCAPRSSYVCATSKARTLTSAAQPTEHGSCKIVVACVGMWVGLAAECCAAGCVRLQGWRLSVVQQVMSASHALNVHIEEHNMHFVDRKRVTHWYAEG